MLYTAYELCIESFLALPELAPETREHVGEPDVVIRCAPVNAEGLPNGQQLGPFLWATKDALWLQVPHVARFLVQSGRCIVVDPEPGIDEDSLRVFLLGSAMGALLFQRGLLVLHGNAVEVNGQCMVCVGPSGAGKSTLAAGFAQRGHRILADDVVAVDSSCKALPGFARIKLWKDAADSLQIDCSDLHRVRPKLEKFNYPLGTKFATEPLPVRWIYILNSDNQDSLRLEPIQGVHRFGPLHNNTYRLRFLQGLALKSEHLQLCGQLAGKIRLASVTRPKSGFQLDALIKHLMADMAAHP